MGMVIVVLVNVALIGLLGKFCFEGGRKVVKSERKAPVRPTCRWTVIRRGVFHS